jgi:hypothetical protein
MSIGGVLAIFGVALLAAAFVFVLERIIPAGRREPHNNIVGFIYAVIGITYAVLLGLVAVATWDTLETALANTYTEANALVQLDLYGHTLPQPQHAEIQSLVKRYAKTVINIEWPKLADHQDSPQAWNLVVQLRFLIEGQQPTAPAAVIRYQQALDTVVDLGNARRERIDQATHGIPGLLWASLIIGAVITIGFGYFFGPSSTRVHALVMFCLTLLITGVLLVPYELNDPFAGPVKVSPAAFQLALQRIDAVS